MMGEPFTDWVKIKSDGRVASCDRTDPHFIGVRIGEAERQAMRVDPTLGVRMVLSQLPDESGEIVTICTKFDVPEIVFPIC